MNQVADAVGYSLAFARDMIPAKMAPYSASLPPIYRKFAGQYLALGGPGRGVEQLTGDWGDRAVMLGVFPDYASVGGFWSSPEYLAAKQLRAGAVKVDACRLPGRRAPDRHTLVLVLAVSGADDLGALMQATVTTATDASVLAPLGVGGFETLEGDLQGHEIGIVSCADPAALTAYWNALHAALKPAAKSLQAFSVARAARK